MSPLPIPHPKDLARWAFWVPSRNALDPARPQQLRRLWPLWRSVYHVGGAQRERMRLEFRTIFGDTRTEAEIEQIVRDSYRISFRVHLEELLMGKFDPDTVNNFLDVRGVHNLEKALERGKGVIILSAHAGCFMLPIAWLSLKGYPYTQYAARGLPPEEMAKEHPEALPTNRWQRTVIDVKNSHEDRLPADFITMKTPTREIFRRLGRNELMALAFDGRVGNKWVRTELLGRGILLTPGAYRLAKSTGAAIVPTLCHTPPDATSVCELGEPIIPDGRDWKEMMRFFLAEHADPWLRKYPAEYGTWLAHCRIRAAVDDHPLFIDYSPDDRWKRFPAL